MRSASKVIKAASYRHRNDFKNWIKRTPDNVLSIEEIRKITAKIPYSMADEGSDVR